MMRAMDSHLFSLDALAWGWIHLIIGIALVAVGLVLALYSQRDPWPTAGIATTILSGVAMFWVPLDITAGYQQVLAYVVVLFALTTDPDRTSDDEQLDDEV